MLRQGRQGMVEFRLVVDEQGQVANCHVDLDTPGPFGEATCNAISRRARFKPALDAEGRPMRALYVCSVEFKFA
jgi:protein TonB